MSGYFSKQYSPKVYRSEMDSPEQAYDFLFLLEMCCTEPLPTVANCREARNAAT
ncbi:hypothetical protein Q31a_32580 [Aureliella helgolandensis]|uniref:Uncharacterized protein n=1 Tax=Aureliella helgolandensis TaxID=2527968 RepID=A0A518G8L9_9BACT|nr:hypothetical protein Q31a_32580 [Aureliella helgolandensis]